MRLSGIALSLALLCLFAGPTFSADDPMVAPASVAGKVYHDYFFQRGTSQTQTIVFEDETRFTYLLRHLSDSDAVRELELTAPKSNGTYTYVRKDARRASISYNFADGTSDTRSYVFVTPASGSEETFSWERRFFLTDLGTWKLSASNTSMRAQVGKTGQIIVGFVVPEAPPSTIWTYFSDLKRWQLVLVRVVGPSLRQFGVASPWLDPNFKLYRGSVPVTTSPGVHGNWSETSRVGATSRPDAQNGFSKVFSYVSAFPLPVGSKDAAGIFYLSGGNYTVVCQANTVGDEGGEALVEIYILP